MAKDFSKKALALHKKLGGKLRIVPAAPIKNRNDLSLVYTPGVGAVSTFLAKHTVLQGRYSINFFTGLAPMMVIQEFRLKMPGYMD